MQHCETLKSSSHLNGKAGGRRRRLSTLPRLLACSLCLWFLSGCAAAVPGATTADGALQKNILSAIAFEQKNVDPGCPWEVADTRVVEKIAGARFEEWLIISCGRKIVYTVDFIPAANGGTTVDISRETY